MFIFAAGCASAHVFGRGYMRPPALVGEWIDVEKTTATDTSIWILRADGYDGFGRVRIDSAAGGPNAVTRSETRFGTWYFEGTLGDTAHQQICFSQRLGRFGTTCVSFTLDTTAVARRLVLLNYQGAHHTSARVMIRR